MTILPNGMKQGRTLPSSCPKLCLLYEPDLAAHNSHSYKTYLLYATAKLIAGACQLTSLQFFFSWLRTHLQSEGSWCTDGIFFIIVSIPWRESSLLIFFLQRNSNVTCFSTVMEYFSLEPFHTLLWLWDKCLFIRPCTAKPLLWQMPPFPQRDSIPS